MDNDHGITGELREWAKALSLWWYDPVKNEYTYTTGRALPPLDAIRLDEHILAIADRIDAAHERAVMSVMNDALYHANDESMAELGWVRLPKDADGKYIHFGDVLDQFGTPMTVFAMSDPDPDQGDCMLELITDGISDGIWVRARKMRHHKLPAVEAVLCELLDKVDDDRAGQAEIIAEYAKRLRLAGDAE